MTRASDKAYEPLGSIAPGAVPPPRRPALAWADALLRDHGVLRIGWRNWGVVEPGRLYRSNHPLPWQLRAAARRFGLRTVVNLRGWRQDCGADALSRREAARLGLVHVDAPLESRGAPHRDRLLRLVEIFSRMEEPALLHCKSGADRTGLAAGVWLLLQGRSVAEAAAQLSWRYGHVKAAKTGILDAFFAEYAAAGDVPFVAWLEQGYDEAGLKARFQARRGLGHVLVEKVLRRE
ncbi:MAG: tyrosine-protein phosphatase [Acetobacteraceae bacterium]|nr:tyrosine-protein phosphatase [Acetobacteraceae bacterium]MCX7684340.1 tyrosine-protein phosphatase [Acetobacteraceae bacterium]